MKKEYIKPEVLVEEVLLEGMLALSDPSQDFDHNEGEGDDSANDRRGGWGNLWD